MSVFDRIIGLLGALVILKVIELFLCVIGWRRR